MIETIQYAAWTTLIIWFCFIFPYAYEPTWPKYFLFLICAYLVIAIPVFIIFFLGYGVKKLAIACTRGIYETTHKK